MALSACLPLAVDRYGAAVRTVIIRGLDLTGVTMRAQVRLRPDTPGDPLIDLEMGANTSAEGLYLVSAVADDTYGTISTVQIRINETTLEGLPYAGELGDSSTFAWDWQATIGGDKRRLVYGDFVVLPGVTGADSAPADRPAGTGTPSSPTTWSTAVLTFGTETVEITIDGADILARAETAAVQAEAAAEAIPTSSSQNRWYDACFRALRDANPSNTAAASLSLAGKVRVGSGAADLTWDAPAAPFNAPAVIIDAIADFYHYYSDGAFLAGKSLTPSVGVNIPTGTTYTAELFIRVGYAGSVVASGAVVTVVGTGAYQQVDLPSIVNVASGQALSIRLLRTVGTGKAKVLALQAVPGTLARPIAEDVASRYLVDKANTAAGAANAAATTASGKADAASTLANRIGVNLLSDPTLKQASRGRVTYGAPLDLDPANPLGGGSVTSVGTLIRYDVDLADTPFKPGDTINIRALVNAAVTVSLTIEWYNGATYLGNVATTANGLTDKTLNTTIPATATKWRVDVSGGDSVLYGVAAYYAPVTPAFVDAPVLKDRREINGRVVGRKIVVFGDSIPADTIDLSTLPYQTYDTILARLLDATVVNGAIGGTTLSLRADDANYSAVSTSSIVSAIAAAASGDANAWDDIDTAATALGYPVPDKIAAIKAIDWSTVDTLLIKHGTNDFGAANAGNGVPLGADTDATGATVKGAVNQVVRDVHEWYPHLKIVFATPLFRGRFAGKGSGFATIDGTLLTVSSYAGDPIALGQSILMAGVSRRALISGIGTGTGGVGTYALDKDCGVVGGTSTASSIAGTVLTIGGTVGGAFAVGDQITGTGVTFGTRIAAQLSGTAGGAGTYRVYPDQTVASTAISSGHFINYDPTTNSDAHPNNAGLKLADYAAAIRDRAAANHAPVIDAFAKAGWNEMTVTRLSEDGLHPSPRVGLYQDAEFDAAELARLSY
jgi:hypothetical protein